MTDADGLGDLVRRFRLDARLSQEALAERAGLSARAVSDIERGTSRPRAITLSLLEEALCLNASAREQIRSAGRAPGHEAAKTEPAWSEPERLVGRAAELARARAAIVEQRARLITFVGGPGVGKTALAHAVAREVAGTFEQTVLIDLAAVPAADLMPSRVALAAGVHHARGDSVARAIAETIDGRRVLFVLDTFEHVAASAPFVAELLAAAAGAALVVTSRVALRLPNEFVVTVEPLQAADAVELLIARAEIAGGFMRNAACDGALTRLIAILEGVPLAIELAAPLLAVASPEDLAAKLEQRLPLLSTSTSEDTASRRTMRGAIAWSYDLLPENERRLFRYLGVFRGSFGLDAVAAVATDGPTQPLDTLQVLATLVQQNLLRSGYASGFLRLEFSAFMREYAAEQLEARGEFDQVMERLAGHCLAVAETFRDLATTQTAEMLARYEPVLPNFDAVLAWALRTKRIALGLQLANAAWKYWWLRGTGLVALSWLRALLAVVESGVAALDDALATRSYNTAAAAAEACGQYHDAAAFAEKALPIARRSGDTQTVANLLTGIGIRASEHGDFERARGFLEEGLALRREAGDPIAVGMSLHDLGQSAANAGNDVAAATYLEEGLASFHSGGSDIGVAMVLYVLGTIAIRARMLDRAETFVRESLRIAGAIGHATVAAGAREALGRIALYRGEHDAAEALIREAIEAFIQAGALAQAVDAADSLADVQRQRGAHPVAARLLGAAAAQRRREAMHIAPADLPQYERLTVSVRTALGAPLFDGEFTIGGALGIRRVFEALPVGSTT